MALSACIFDLDGVIVDTAKYHYLAWKRLAGELGFDFTPADNEHLKGVSRMRSLDILLQIGGIKMDPAQKEEAATKKNAWYVEYISRITPAEILPGVLDFLDELEEHGIRRAVGSASKNAGSILTNLKIEKRFQALVDGNHITKAKPDPEIFLLAARMLRCSPRECIVFEDAQAGVEAARNGGMFSIGVGDAATLKEADMVISGFSDFNLDQLMRDFNNLNYR